MFKVSRVFVSLIVMFSIFHLSSTALFAEGACKVGGKVYDKDERTPLAGAVIHLTSADTGASIETRSNQDGCYNFKEVEKGTYSVSVSHDGKDFFLTEKIRVEAVNNKKVAISLCLALTETTELKMLDSCKFCGPTIPLGYLVVGGAGAVAAGILIGRGEEEVVSPSQPSRP